MCRVDDGYKRINEAHRTTRILSADCFPAIKPMSHANTDLRMTSYRRLCRCAHARPVANTAMRLASSRRMHEARADFFQSVETLSAVTPTSDVLASVWPVIVHWLRAPHSSTSRGYHCLRRPASAFGPNERPPPREVEGGVLDPLLGSLEYDGPLAAPVDYLFLLRAVGV